MKLTYSVKIKTLLLMIVPCLWCFSALYMNIPLYALFVTMFSMVGLLMVAYFKDCDPMLQGRITRVDQVCTNYPHD